MLFIVLIVLWKSKDHFIINEYENRCFDIFLRPLNSYHTIFRVHSKIQNNDSFRKISRLFTFSNNFTTKRSFCFFENNSNLCRKIRVCNNSCVETCTREVTKGNQKQAKVPTKEQRRLNLTVRYNYHSLRFTYESYQ